jgi:hypothetical protein
MYYPSLRALSLIASQPGEEQALLESGYANESNIHKHKTRNSNTSSSEVAVHIICAIFILKIIYLK